MKQSVNLKPATGTAPAEEPLRSSSAGVGRPSLLRIAGHVLRGGARRLGSPMSRATERYFGVVRAVATDRPLLALTFDDGPHPDSTTAVLRVLEKHRARGTFFMVGELAARHPDVVRAAAEAGHTIANHSWSHVSFPLLNGRERRAQLLRSAEALAPHGVKLFRPPYLHQTLGSGWDARRAGYDVVGFSIHAEDWLARPAAWMADKLVREARPGAIVILHDNIYRSVLAEAAADRRAMVRALDEALDRLQERFSFVTVPELMRSGRAIRQYWQSRGSAEMQAALERNARDARRLEHEPAMACPSSVE